MNRRILLLGGSGQLGTALARLLDDVVAPSHHEFDLASIGTGATRRLVEEIKPSALVNCAGYTMVDRAEEEPDLAHSINGAAVGILAGVAGEVGIPFVTFSTDYVFDGQATMPYVESSYASPINAYGRSKLAGEDLALKANPASLVVRTSWVISASRRNFATRILQLASIGKPFKVVDDQLGCPTIADDLAKVVLEAMNHDVSGVLHLTNSDPATWFALAKAVIGAAGLDDRLVVPCATSEYPTTAVRPSYSVLGSERFTELNLDPLPPWRESLANVVDDHHGDASLSRQEPA